MPKYKPTIGLEIHAELTTKTKMFCDSKNDPDEKNPNVNICPVCMAHPGTLPVINKEAVKKILLIGKALGGMLADFSEFDRKNYFYPDIPKGYQISQYKYPLVSGGSLNEVAITRVHLEEDTARSMHDQNDKETLIDFNRAGVPLMELVTEPVIKSADEAVAFAKELQLLLRYLGASEANMEKGEMRVEANVSVSDDERKGTKVEIKNLNSFRVVGRAIAYETERQSKLLAEGGKVIQETRGWDEKKEETFSQRQKEESHDYRYFSEPDLPKLKISVIPEFKDLELPELPQDRRERFKDEFGIKEEDIESYIQNFELGSFFESVAKELGGDKEALRLASNYITSDVLGIMKITSYEISAARIGKLEAGDFADLIMMVKKGEISSRGVKDILPKTLAEEATSRALADTLGVFQKSDVGELMKIVEKVIAENKKAMDEYRAGKEASLGFLIGQAMRESKGSANPQVLSDLFKKSLETK